jgi:glycosyltransferase involved in cell wall biosynthesis
MFDRIIYRQYDRIVTISKDVDAKLKEHLGKGFTNIRLIPNGIDLEKIITETATDVSEFDLVENQKILIQVSSFTPQKDQKTVINCIPYLKNICKLILVGDGPLLKKSKELATNLGIEDKVLFLGIRMDVPKLLKMSDIVILSTHFEGLSLSCIEGLASGCPVDASKAPGLFEIVNGVGVTFPIGDAIYLANEIDALLDNSIYYNEIASKCEQRAKEHDMDVMINRYLLLYNEVLK